MSGETTGRESLFSAGKLTVTQTTSGIRVSIGDEPRSSEPQWFVERGQPEGLPSHEWSSHSVFEPSGWTTNPHNASMWPTREAAEEWIKREGLEARATEHTFFWTNPPVESQDLTLEEAAELAVAIQGALGV